jgi:hypothetical protein
MLCGLYTEKACLKNLQRRKHDKRNYDANLLTFKRLQIYGDAGKIVN